VDVAGRLWVGEYGNHRLLRFDDAAAKPNGAPADGVLGQPDFTSSVATTTRHGMNKPAGIAVDSAGTLWVADAYNHRVLRFDDAAAKPNGAPADGVLGQPDFVSRVTTKTRRGMNYPQDVAMDSTRHLWVADSAWDRVLMFDVPQR
jgi:DNA-binding beta-propeller fold protein YncE